MQNIFAFIRLSGVKAASAKMEFGYEAKMTNYYMNYLNMELKWKNYKTKNVHIKKKNKTKQTKKKTQKNRDLYT